MREITCQEVHEQRNKVRIIDVRTPEEFKGELGHIENAELVTLGPDLINFLNTLNRDESVVFVCRSGARSGQTTLLSEEMGFRQTSNMLGGMIQWNNLNLPVVKE
ncbi:rhodanese-like domain-containing protein [Bdellovibrio svalbardensis]|uniref:Rhodanese-like domain-containing protein n=1 Tax=Bdellovibrio svalbardensis TaxID=2972972 RepID=A0ABT6DLK9_9BACT|nr:rhodanese-like domain-containing protein [Bdellovibrio svalbardensis]MDG0817765.1 rhodanese-like domain-containing protein [Bdellovibrio svalbardensis]